MADKGNDSSSGASDFRLSGQLQAQNAQFQVEIAALDPSESEDPLDVYYRYMQWLIEVFPQAVGHQAVIKLAEQPLKLFREQERYRNDARYVKMWIWYTGLINEGQDAVFQFLLANKIGDSLAILYEEYAKALESLSKVRKADEVYQLGIARKAQPLARLQRRFDEFQRRVMAQTVRGAAVDAPPPPPEAASSQRTMLGTKRTARSAHSAAANTLPASQRGIPSSAAAPGSRANARIAVFADPDGTTSGTGAADAAQAAADPAAAAPWLDIGSDEARRKENIRDASSWRGQKLEQRRPPASSAARASAAAGGAFTVFRDEPEPEPPAALEGPAGGSRAGKPKSGKPKAATAAAAERMVMPESILFPAGDGAVQCAEEARAKLPRYRFDFDQWALAQGLDRGLDQGPSAGHFRPATPEEEDSDDSTAGFGRRVAAAGCSPTINTRAAQNGMLDMWNDLSGSDADADADADSDSESLLGRDAGHRAAHAGSGGASAHAADDDYQFTMGPVMPNVVPDELSHRPPVIPTSARVATRFESFTGPGDGDAGDDMPTVVLNSIRAAKRQEMRLMRGPGGGGLNPTPLAFGSGAGGSRARRGLRSIGEESESAGSSDDERAGGALAGAQAGATPAQARQRMHGFGGGGSAHPAPLQFSGSSLAAAASPHQLYHSTPARIAAAPGGRSASLSSSARFPHTPGYTRTTSAFSVSGAELTGLSGFTGVSTIGGPTSSLLPMSATPGRYCASRAAGVTYEEEDDDFFDRPHGLNQQSRRPGNGSGSIAHTPLRKRLSMAAKDLGKLTPRFPKTLDGADGEQYQHGHGGLDDDDDDIEDEDDGDEPCTENIGEFADLEGQMTELEMRLGAKFMHRQEPSPPPAVPVKKPAPPAFTIYRD
ncbi:protein kinase [Coemansia sp. RSA 2322]|nr:protein kinase [Coemansia sp. RSA 2322]